MNSKKSFAQLYRAWMTQSIMGILSELAMDNTYYTLCGQQVHSQPQAVSGISRGRPSQAPQPNGAVFACYLAAGANRARTALPSPPSSVCIRNPGRDLVRFCAMHPRSPGCWGTGCNCAHPTFEGWC